MDVVSSLSEKWNELRHHPQFVAGLTNDGQTQAVSRREREVEGHVDALGRRAIVDGRGVGEGRRDAGPGELGVGAVGGEVGVLLAGEGLELVGGVGGRATMGGGQVVDARLVDRAGEVVPDVQELARELLDIVATDREGDAVDHSTSQIVHEHLLVVDPDGGVRGPDVAPVRRSTGLSLAAQGVVGVGVVGVGVEDLKVLAGAGSNLLDVEGEHDLRHEVARTGQLEGNLW